MMIKLALKSKKLFSIFVIMALVLGVFFISLPSKVYAAEVWYVDGLNGNDGHGGHSFGDAKKTIQATITAAAADDTIFVAATADYPEDLVIDKTLNIIGRKANGTTNSWTTYTPGSEDGPTITYDGVHPRMINFAADDIVMYGFEIDVTDIAVWGIEFDPVGSVVDGASIDYCTFTMDGSDRGVAVDETNVLSNSYVSYCSFDGPADGDATWFMVGAGSGASGDGGGVTGMILENNIVREASSYLLLDGDITNVAYNSNDIYQTVGAITLSEPVEQGPCDFTNIFIDSCTFTDGSLDEYAVMVSDDVEDADLATGDWFTDLQITDCTISTGGVNTFPTVSFEGGVHATDICAINNFWGSSTGPYNAIGNPTGDGVQVGDDVNFSAYRLSAYWTSSGAAKGNVIIASSNSRLYQSRISTNGKLYTRFSTNGTTWSTWVNGGPARSVVAMVDFNSKLYQTKRGVDNCDYTRSTSNGTTWSGWVKGGTCLHTVSLCVFGSKLYQAKRASDNKFYSRYTSNGTTWSKWVAAGPTVGNITMCVFNAKLYQMKRTSSNAVYIRSSNDGVTWSAWVGCGSALGDVALVSFTGRIYQAKRVPGGLYTRSSGDGATWNAWVEGGACEGAITMASFNGRIYQFKVYGVGLNTFRGSDDGTTWDGWQYQLSGSSGVSVTQFGTELYQALCGNSLAYVTVFY